MAYGTYFRPRRAPNMRDLVDPALNAGVTQNPGAVFNPGVAVSRGFPGPGYADGGVTSAPAAPTTPGATAASATTPARAAGVTDRWGESPEERRARRREEIEARNGKRPPTDPTTPPSNGPEGPAAPSRGSAWKDYGDQDIPGAKESGLWWGANVGQGWNMDRTKEDRGAFTTKNVLGMILSDYPAKPSSIDLFLADPRTKRFFPNARKVGFDKIDLGDGPIDILTKADPETDTAEAWWYNPEAGVEAHGSDWTPWTPGEAAAPETPNDTQPVGDPNPLPDPAAVTSQGYRGRSFRSWLDDAGARGMR